MTRILIYLALLIGVGLFAICFAFKPKILLILLAAFLLYVFWLIAGVIKDECFKK